MQFQYQDQPLKEAPLYLLPCAKRHRVIDRRMWFELLKRVKNGASLYISSEDASFSEFEEVTGLEVVAREERTSPFKLLLDGVEDGLSFTAEGPVKYILKNNRARVLGYEEPDNPVFTSVKYGRGTVYFLSIPLESGLIAKPGAFHTLEAPCWWKIYEHIAKEVVSGRVVSKASSFTGLTEHPLDKNNRVIYMINYSPLPVTERVRLKKGWKLKKVLYGAKTAGSTDSFNLKANDATVFTVRSS